MKHIYISPHSDDVALSCGGQIISDPASRSQTMVLNIFTSESRDSHRELGKMQDNFLDSINDDRTAEDRSAWNSVEIETHYADLPEALLRRRFPFSITRHQGEPEITNAIYDVVLSHIKSNPTATFYFPAAFGKHVDHLACRDAGFQLLDHGLITKLVLYEDIPYCWLRFIRKQYYIELLRHVELEKGSSTIAFRQGGENILGYIKQDMAPFPRGRKLFLAVYLSLLLKNLTQNKSGASKTYRGRVNLTRLDDRVLEKKKQLLYHYKSQIPMLFGASPEDVLHDYHESFSTEVTIELFRKSRG